MSETATTEKEEESEKGPSLEEKEEMQIRDEARGLLRAAIERLGFESPVQLIATDTHLMRFLSEEFIVRHRLAEQIAMAGTETEAEKALNELARIALSDKNLSAKKAVKAGAIDAILCTMARLKTSVTVQSCSCLALANCCWCKEVQTLIAESNGLESVVAAMKAFKTSATVQELGMCSWRNIAPAGSPYTERIVAQGGCELIVEAIRNFPGVVNVLEEAMCAITTISFGNSDVKKRLVDLGAIELALDAIRDHKSSITVQEWGLAAVRGLTCRYPPGKKRAADVGAIEVIAQTMTGFIDTVVIQEQGACAFCNISADNHENQKRCAELGAIECVIAAMRQHPTAPRVQANGALALGNIVTTEETKRLVDSSGGIEAILAALHQLPDDPQVAEMALYGLKNISSDSKDHVTRVVKLGGVVAILEAMKKHQGVALVEEEGCHALGNLAFAACAENQRLIAEASGIEIVLDVARRQRARGEDGEKAVFRAFSALVRLASFNPENQLRICEAGGIGDFVGALEGALSGSPLLRGSREDLVNWAAFGLWHCLSSSLTHPRFLTKEAIGIVSLAIQKFPSSKELVHCLASLERTVHPAIAEARARGCCTQITAPFCKKQCSAARGLYCEVCAVSGIWHLCQTCAAGSPGKGSRLCEQCFAQFHAGHVSISVWRPGSCDRQAGRHPAPAETE